MQRLVIILPVEERDTDTSALEGDQNFSPGGPAGTTAMGSKNIEGFVNNPSGAYDLLWDSVNKKYVHASAGVSDGVQGDGHVQGQGDGNVQEQSDEHVQEQQDVCGADGHKGHNQQHEVQEQQDVGGAGGQKGQGGHEPHHDGLVGDDQAHLRDAENENEEGFENEERKFKKSYSENLKSCSILDTKFEIEDYEGVIYRELSRKIDWSV